MFVYILMGVIAYLIGSVNFSVLISKKFAGFDVREKGSGNAGSTNMLRTAGKKLAALTLVCDILKGVVSIGIAVFIASISNKLSGAVLVQIAALLVVIGHTFPVFFGFKGGKGVATSLGVILVLNYQIGLICLVFALIIMIATKMVSLGSILAAVLFPILALFIHDNYIIAGNYFIFGILLAAMVIYNHRTNLKRILDGNESKLNLKKDKE